MSWPGAHFCSPCMTCSMIRIDGAKGNCDCSLLTCLCGYIVVELFLVSLVFLEEQSQALLILIFLYLTKLAKEAMMSPTYFIENSAVSNRVHNWKMFSSKHMYAYLPMSISISNWSCFITLQRICESDDEFILWCVLKMCLLLGFIIFYYTICNMSWDHYMLFNCSHVQLGTTQAVLE